MNYYCCYYFKTVREKWDVKDNSVQISCVLKPSVSLVLSATPILLQMEIAVSDGENKSH